LSKFAIYQLFVRLFGNSNPNPQINGNIDENGCGKLNTITTDILSKIKNLGITHIWYTGIIRHATTAAYPAIPANNDAIVKGKAGSPYAITDYYDIHPDLAENVAERMSEFEQLLDRTQQEGLKVLIDFVPNHLSREYKSLNISAKEEDFGESDNTSLHFHPQNNYYYFSEKTLTLPKANNYVEYPAKATGNDVFNPYPQTIDWYETIKLNYGVDYLNQKSRHFSPIPKTWRMMKEILMFWSAKRIDGFRCDMAEMVPVEFWAWVIPQIKKKNPDILFIAEIYNPEAYSTYIGQGGFDYLYDKVDFYDTLRLIIEGKQSTRLLSELWKKQNGLETKMLRFLENHDEQRIASRFFANNPHKGIPAFFLTACMHKNPILIYFGQEFGERAEGESGFSGDDGRSTIFDYWIIPSIQSWQNADYKIEKLPVDTQKIYNQYKEIIKFSLNEIAITDGDFYDLMWINLSNINFNSDKVFAFLRCHERSLFLCLSNFSNHEEKIKVIIPEHAFEYCQLPTAKLLNFQFVDYFSGKKLKISGSECIISGFPATLDTNSYAVYQIK